MNSGKHAGLVAQDRTTDWAGHALEALADDRQNVAALRARDPEGASAIADYLALLEGDFQMVETTARALAAQTGPAYRKPYPQHLGSATTYSGSPRRRERRRRVIPHPHRRS